MAGDEAHVSLVAHSMGALSCELCSSKVNTPHATVVVRQPQGSVVQLAACDWCLAALRRLEAATGGHAALAVTGGGSSVASIRRSVPSRARPVSPPALVLEFAERLRDPVRGTAYTARAFGRSRGDGTWEGWIEFTADGSNDVLRTGQETTQSSREGVAYWASGLEATYLEGAFDRARRGSLIV
jgi:hypothetical protein